MVDYLVLSGTPIGENCVQVNKEKDYIDAMRKECEVFKDMLYRTFNPKYTTLAIKTFPHEFGEYCEVVVYYYDDQDDSVNEALNMENNLPEYWDDVAVAQGMKTILNTI